MRRARFLVGLVGVVVLLAAFALLGRFVIHGPVRSDTLAVAVGRATGSAGELLGDAGDCRRERAERTWRCAVTDSEGSGGAGYRVRLRPGSSCWKARLVNDAAEGPMPRDAAGCVYRWQWSLLSLL